MNGRPFDAPELVPRLGLRYQQTGKNENDQQTTHELPHQNCHAFVNP
jgi:hypothetical protein